MTDVALRFSSLSLSEVSRMARGLEILEFLSTPRLRASLRQVMSIADGDDLLTEARRSFGADGMWLLLQAMGGYDPHIRVSGQDPASSVSDAAFASLVHILVSRDTSESEVSFAAGSIVLKAVGVSRRVPALLRAVLRMSDDKALSEIERIERLVDLVDRASMDQSVKSLIVRRAATTVSDLANLLEARLIDVVVDGEPLRVRDEPRAPRLTEAGREWRPQVGQVVAGLVHYVDVRCAFIETLGGHHITANAEDFSVADARDAVAPGDIIPLKVLESERPSLSHHRFSLVDGWLEAKAHGWKVDPSGVIAVPPEIEALFAS